MEDAVKNLDRPQNHHGSMTESADRIQMIIAHSRSSVTSLLCSKSPEEAPSGSSHPPSSLP
jgi:hypothetical protein